MQLVERHVIKRADARFKAIDRAAFASKNLYNAANYVVRQSFIHEGVYLNYHEMHRRMQDHEAYQALPAKVAQWVLQLLDKNWAELLRGACRLAERPDEVPGASQAARLQGQAGGAQSADLHRAGAERSRTASGLDRPVHVGHHRPDQAAERPTGAHHPTPRLLCRGSDLRARPATGGGRPIAARWL